MVYVEGPTRQETDEKFARIWFAAMARFHKVKEPSNWEFDDKHVIAFLRSKLSENMPTWKRLKIVQGLIWYRNYIRKSAAPRLEPIRAKLRDMAAKERESQGEAAAANLEAPIEDVVGKISSREPDVIQAMRRTLRVLGKTLNTEKAYVQKVRAFMEDREKGSRY